MDSLTSSQETDTSAAINWSKRRDTHCLKITESLQDWICIQIFRLFRYWLTNPPNWINRSCPKLNGNSLSLQDLINSVFQIRFEGPEKLFFCFFFFWRKNNNKNEIKFLLSFPLENPQEYIKECKKQNRNLFLFRQQPGNSPFLETFI